MKIKLLFIVMVLLLMSTPVLAQSEPTPAPDLEGTLSAALEMIIKAITNATFVLPAAGLVVALTGLTKHFLPESINAGLIALTFQVILWVIWVLALHAGFGDQFNTWVGALTTIVTAVAGLVASTYASTRIHESSAAHNVPLMGYKRDPDHGSNV